MTFKQFFSFTLLITTLMGCGEDENTQYGATYTGQTNDAQLSGDNMNAYETGGIYSAKTIFAVDAIAQIPNSLEILPFARAFESQVAVGYAYTVASVLMAQTQNAPSLPSGVEQEIEVTDATCDDDFAIPVGDEGQVQFDEFCQEGVTINGSARFTVDRGEESEQLVISFNGLSLSSEDADIQLSGAITINFVFNTGFDMTMAMNARVNGVGQNFTAQLECYEACVNNLSFSEGGNVYRLEDYSFGPSENGLALEATFYEPNHGRVMLNADISGYCLAEGQPELEVGSRIRMVDVDGRVLSTEVNTACGTYETIITYIELGKR